VSVPPPATVSRPAAVVPPAIVEPPPPAGPFVIGTVKDEKGALVQGVRLTATVGSGTTLRTIGDGISNERGEYRFDIELGVAALNVALDKSKPLAETFHDGENRVDVVVNSKVVAKARTNAFTQVCPTSAPGTMLEGHTTSQTDIDELARMLLERGSNAIPDWDLAARGAQGHIAVIADIGNHRRLTTNALPAGFTLADANQLQAQANATRNQLGFLSFQDIWSDGTCATVTVGGDIAVPADPNVIKMCCCSSTTMYEKRAGTWTRTGNVVTSCS
jgi:hypothetical protein